MFCKMCLYWNLSDTFPPGAVGLGKENLRGKVLFSSHCIKGTDYHCELSSLRLILTICLTVFITAYSVFLRFLHCKVTLFFSALLASHILFFEIKSLHEAHINSLKFFYIGGFISFCLFIHLVISMDSYLFYTLGYNGYKILPYLFLFNLGALSVDSCVSLT